MKLSSCKSATDYVDQDILPYTVLSIHAFLVITYWIDSFSAALKLVNVIKFGSVVMMVVFIVGRLSVQQKNKPRQTERYTNIYWSNSNEFYLVTTESLSSAAEKDQIKLKIVVEFAVWFLLEFEPPLLIESSNFYLYLMQIKIIRQKNHTGQVKYLIWMNNWILNKLNEGTSAFIWILKIKD